MNRLFLPFLLMIFPFTGFGNEPLAAGEPAPDLRVTTDAGEELSLGSLYAEGPVLLYFYPKSFTPGCTEQACNLRDNFDAVQAAGIRVIGVSRDSVARQAEFREEHALPFTLVADEEGELGKAFGVGSILGSIHKRQSFLVLDGKVAWSDLSANPSSQAQDVVEALRRLQS